MSCSSTLLSPPFWTPVGEEGTRCVFHTGRDYAAPVTAEWAIRSSADLVLEPSTGEAAFLTAAVERLIALGHAEPLVHGVEIHPPSAKSAHALVAATGGRAQIKVSDFFLVDATLRIRRHHRQSSLHPLSGVDGRAARSCPVRGTSSGSRPHWAFVELGCLRRALGRLLEARRTPWFGAARAELLSVNYAAPVRRFLLENFGSVELVVFDEQVFSDAEADTVLVRPTVEAGPRRASISETNPQRHDAGLARVRNNLGANRHR